MMTCSHPHLRLAGRLWLALLIVAALSQHPLRAHAQDDNVSTNSDILRIHFACEGKTHSYMFGVGSADVLDTYLSAESYRGTELRYISATAKPTRWDGVRQTIVNEGQLDVVSNRVDNNDELGGRYRFEYRLQRQWCLGRQFYLEAGAGIGAELGFLYNTRNSNNPAQAYAALQLLPAVAARKMVYLFGWPVLFGYEASVPLVGLMFSPNYGQSYYEIFSRGNYDHNLVPTTIVSTPSLRHMLTADIPLSRNPRRHSMLRVGYLGDYQQAKVNNLRQHHLRHLLVLGWVKVF